MAPHRINHLPGTIGLPSCLDQPEPAVELRLAIEVLIQLAPLINTVKN